MAAYCPWSESDFWTKTFIKNNAIIFGDIIYRYINISFLFSFKMLLQHSQIVKLKAFSPPQGASKCATWPVCSDGGGDLCSCPVGHGFSVTQIKPHQKTKLSEWLA